ncbi:DUF4265 domain-containing protein [Paludibacter jiangxiensis]|uniref:DUF4265 domain-containing protein n=1 Tax=Paludibacter jiangxiensis TaxID=681398 RepID=A0A170YXG8_9BACT|nr:DUF4265 domain-containing protein [Paludibacter jiangxiensis]GAT62159.1 hypothetical protein PJIAN_1750 [Paludibacter jiangxiensis]
MKKQERVFFVQKNHEGDFETESIWCTRVDNGFQIDNIPIVAKRISLGDIITAEYDNDDKVYYFDDFVSVSGNTTVRLFFKDACLMENVRQILNKFGCESEVLVQRKIVAVNIPQNVEYKNIKHFLDKGENENKWVYEESCLCHEY